MRSGESIVIASTLEQKVATLESKLVDACDRIAELERLVPRFAHRRSEEVGRLPPRDSEPMEFALKLAAQCFPGGVVTVDLESNPEEPASQWYCLAVRWNGTPEDSLRRQDQWHREFDQQHADQAIYFRLFVALE
jgi:hypothetical protein